MLIFIVVPGKNLDDGGSGSHFYLRIFCCFAKDLNLRGLATEQTWRTGRSFLFIL